MTCMPLVYIGIAIFFITGLATLFLISKLEGEKYQDFVTFMIVGYSLSFTIMFFSYINVGTAIGGGITLVAGTVATILQRRAVKEDREVARIRREREEAEKDELEKQK